MIMRKMNETEREKVTDLIREAEEIYGVQKDNRIIEYVQKGMIDAGLRVKVPVKKFKRFLGGNWR